jgi:succinate dehydrogenase subunit C
MARPVNPHSMTPSRPGRTRTAAPQAPSGWYAQPRMLRYLLFDATGIVYLLVGFVALRVVWALGSGEAAWAELMRQLQNPLYVGFHLLALVCVVFVAVRFFRLFPKAQPAHIGPAKPPPGPVILAGLYAAWIGITLVVTAILAGWVLR